MTRLRLQLRRSFFWLLPILVLVVASSAFAYDFENWGSDAYDGETDLVSHYDGSVACATNESAKQSTRARGHSWDLRSPRRHPFSRARHPDSKV